MRGKIHQIEACLRTPWHNWTEIVDFGHAEPFIDRLIGLDRQGNQKRGRFGRRRNKVNRLYFLIGKRFVSVPSGAGAPAIKTKLFEILLA